MQTVFRCLRGETSEEKQPARHAGQNKFMNRHLCDHSISLDLNIHLPSIIPADTRLPPTSKTENNIPAFSAPKINYWKSFLLFHGQVEAKLRPSTCRSLIKTIQRGRVNYTVNVLRAQIEFPIGVRSFSQLTGPFRAFITERGPQRTFKCCVENGDSNKMKIYTPFPC